MQRWIENWEDETVTDILGSTGHATFVGIVVRASSVYSNRKSIIFMFEKNHFAEII